MKLLEIFNYKDNGKWKGDFNPQRDIYIME